MTSGEGCEYCAGSIPVYSICRGGEGEDLVRSPFLNKRDFFTIDRGASAIIREYFDGLRTLRCAARMRPEIFVHLQAVGYSERYYIVTVASGQSQGRRQDP